MKVYLHCPLLDFTAVFVCEVDDALSSILERFQKVIALNFSGDYRIVEAKNPHGLLISPSSNIKTFTRNCSDLFVSVQKQPGANVTGDCGGKEVNGRSHVVDRRSHMMDSAGKSCVPIVQDRMNQATVLVGNQRYRKALEVYDSVLQDEKNNKAAYIGKVRTYLKAGRFTLASKTARKALTLFPNYVELLCAAGEAYVGCKDGDGAVKVLQHCVKVARGEGGLEGLEKQNLHLLLARAYLVRGEADMAIALLQGVLRENMDHDEALTEYAVLLYPLGDDQAEEAMSIIIGVLARHPKDKRAKEVFATLMKQPTGMTVLKNVAASAFNDSSALIYLGTCLKEFSVIDSSLSLFKEALSIDPVNPGHVLIYMHALELLDNTRDILLALTSLLGSFQDGPTSLVFSPTLFHYCSSVIPVLDGKCESANVPNLLPPSSAQLETVTQYSDNDLQLLACLFTAVKVMFVKGHLQVLPPLLAYLAPLYKGGDLPRTCVRNEAAYYGCVSRLMQLMPSTLNSMCQAQDSSVYFLGDSHCLPPAWRHIQLKVGHQGKQKQIFGIIKWFS